MRFSEITPVAPGAVPPPATVPPPAPVTNDPQAQAKMIAQQALDKVNQKKQLQDQIKSKQEELASLQKQLVSMK